MPLYYFHTRDGHVRRDAEGVDLPDLEAAKCTALEYLGELAKDRSAEILQDGYLNLCVTDAEGLHLLEVELVVTIAPAARLKQAITAR